MIVKVFAGIMMFKNNEQLSLCLCREIGKANDFPGITRAPNEYHNHWLVLNDETLKIVYAEKIKQPKQQKMIPVSDKGIEFRKRLGRKIEMNGGRISRWSMWKRLLIADRGYLRLYGFSPEGIWHPALATYDRDGSLNQFETLPDIKELPETGPLRVLTKEKEQ